MTKLKLRTEARKLRKQGLGIKTISYRLNVSSSTVSLWCRDIQLTQKQLEKLNKRARDPYYGKRLDYLLKVQNRRIDKIEKLRQKGIKDIGSLSKREFFIAGVALYWAEGFKKDRRLGFANSDPTMIKFFLNWLIKDCKVPKKHIRLRVGLNISHENRIQEVEKYWSELTNVTLKQFQKPFFQKFVWKKKYPNPDKYFGVLRIRANKQLPLFRTIHGWIGGLKLNSLG